MEIDGVELRHMANNIKYCAEYYKNNKQLYLEKASKKCTCECGSTIRIGDMSIHFKSKKHIKYINSLVI